MAAILGTRIHQSLQCYAHLILKKGGGPTLTPFRVWMGLWISRVWAVQKLC